MTDRYKKLRVDISQIKPGVSTAEIFNQVPNLKRYFAKPWTEYSKAEDVPDKFRAIPLHLGKVIKYIVLMYDPETPLINEHPDEIGLRKEAALKEAGFDRDENGEWAEEIQEMMTFKNEIYMDWMLDYLKLCKNTIFTQLVMIDEELETLNRSRGRAIRDGTIRADHLTLTKERTKEREILLKKFYAEHNDLENASEKKLFPISPENVFIELPEAVETWKMKQVKDVPPRDVPAVT